MVYHPIEKNNVKIAMANGTSCEPAIEEVDLSKCNNKLKIKEKSCA